MEEIRFRPIGLVHTKASDDQIKNRIAGTPSTIEIFPEFREALEGLEGLSHIFVLGYFNRLRPEQVGPLRVRPKGLLRLGLKLEELPLIGVLALDSPTRPNPIGLSLVPLLGIENGSLLVSDLDYFDATPVLDIKPYQKSYRVDDYTLPDWHVRLLEKAGRV
jgi:tRNA (adenine37-N6)-methyltransferase